MSSNTTSQNPLYQLEAVLDEYLVKKAPFQIPDNGKEAIVKFMPWIILVLMVLALPAILALLGLGAFLTPFAMLGGYAYGINNVIYGVFVLISVILEIIALPGLFAKEEKGWRFLFYSNLVSLIAGIIGGTPINALIFAVISFYILFQIKEKYR